MDATNIAYVILSFMHCTSLDVETLESRVFDAVDAPADKVNDVIDELLDAGYMVPTICAETHKPALILTDAGLGAWQTLRA